MKLFHVQDSDRPMYVLGENWMDALNRWKEFIAKENEMLVNEVGEPDGVALVADNDELIG